MQQTAFPPSFFIFGLVSSNEVLDFETMVSGYSRLHTCVTVCIRFYIIFSENCSLFFLEEDAIL